MAFTDYKKRLPQEKMQLPALRKAPELEKATLENLPGKLRKACENAHWTSLTPVQSLVIPYLLQGDDVMVQSRTGSGKTGCYLLPLLKTLDPSIKKVQALVLVPTRELALQVEREARTLFSGSGLSAVSIYGGVGYDRQLQALRSGSQLVIGTPGRTIDHLIRKTLDLSTLRNLIFDEADRMLSIGFYPDIQEIAGYLPIKRQTCLFSATYPPYVIKLASEFMQDPIMLSLSQNEVHVAEVEHLYAPVKAMDKDRALVRMLETENPASAIIFCNTKAEVHYIAELLKSLGYSAGELSGDLNQKQREEVLNKIRDGKIKYLVATDVAARGIDIPELSHVFMYQPPDDRESYIHRAGRTGRAGAAGTVISLVDPRDKADLDRIGKFYKINMRETKVPTEEDVAKTSSIRLNTQLESRVRSLTGQDRSRINHYLELAKDLASRDGENDQEKLSIIAMLLDNYRRTGMHDNFPALPEKPQIRYGGRKPSKTRPAPKPRLSAKPPYRASSSSGKNSGPRKPGTVKAAGNRGKGTGQDKS